MLEAEGWGFGMNRFLYELDSDVYIGWFIVIVSDRRLGTYFLVFDSAEQGPDVGAAFGSGSSNTVFGSSGGALLMTRLTWSIGFFLSLLGSPTLPRSVGTSRSSGYSSGD